MILWQGKSLIDGNDIVLIATGINNRSVNAKTGAMVQTWILRADMHPWEAIKTGQDSSICGTCPHRGENGRARSCYVNLFHGPTAVYKAFRDGKYPQGTIPSGMPVRIGSYGDPGAVPSDVILDIARNAEFSTGYTHLWRTCDQSLRNVLMASCDTEEERIDAENAGWRVFYVVPEGTKPQGLTQCPADKTLRTGITCSDCRQCDGAESRHRFGKYIVAHGIGRKMVSLRMA